MLYITAWFVADYFNVNFANCGKLKFSVLPYLVMLIQFLALCSL
jgi:hypothetical protein